MKKEKFGVSEFFSLLILVLAAIVFTIGTTARAATLPVFEPLASIDVQVDKPTAVTVDARGHVYVVESDNNQVRIFTQSGHYLASLTGLTKPISVAVDATGRIYVGSAALGSVTVFAADFTKLSKLGNGDGEFIEPADIDIDSSGQIYVVDKDKNTVLVYSAAGVLLKSIGASGNGDGQLHHPTSLAIDPISSELVIIDHPQIWDDISQGLIDGARIQFFGMNGTFRRGYPKFGYNMNAGQLVKPMQVVVDPESRVYVSDSRWQKVMVYDKTGNFLGMIDNSAHPLRTPLGLCMAASGRLYVASLLGGKVDVYGIDAHSGMNLAPVVLNFTSTEGGNTPEPQTVTINNNGKHALTWNAATNAAWLNLASVAGILQPTATYKMTVGCNIAGLAQGIYQENISINVMGMMEKVAVTLTVKPNPLLISPTSLSLATTKNITPASSHAFLALLFVNNAGTDQLEWSAAADQSWLKLSKATGTTRDQIEINTDISALTLGTHTATITFTNKSTGGSVLIPVTLNINEPNPLLISPDSLSFTTTTGTSPSPLALSVDNAGTNPLSWSAATDQSWLNLSKTTGTAPDQIEINTNISALNPGTHTATITFINDSTGDSILVPVSMSISEPNLLLVSPASLSLTATKDTSPSTLASTRSTNWSTLTLSEIDGMPPLSWGAVTDQSWLKLSKKKGATPDQVKIVTDISALAPGTHTATITFSNKSTGGNVLVPVSLTVSKFNPLLVSPASLSFTTKKGINPPTLAISVTNETGNDPLHWSATANQSWLKLSKENGTTGSTPPDDNVEIDADVSDLAPGTYSGTITFINDSTGDSVLVPVTLKTGTFPWLLIIQNIAIIGEKKQKQDKEDIGQTNKNQQPTKIDRPKSR